MSSVVLVAQMKGGCSKSTTAMQVIAPWIMSREGGARLIEVDQYNQDSEDYQNTDIITKQINIPENNSHGYAATMLMEEIISSDESIVIDLGGNATTKELVAEMGMKGVSSFIDLIVIPVSAPGRDVLNAKATIDYIKERFSQFDAPILLVYSRAPNSDMSRLKFEAPDVFNLAKKEKLAGPLVIPNKGCFSTSRFLLKTAWEVSNEAETIIEEIKNKQFEAKKNKDVEAGSKLVLMRTIVEESASLTPFFEDAFSQLDALLPLDGGSADSRAPEAAAEASDE